VRSVEELLEYARTTKATLLVSERIRLDERLAERLDCPPGSEWVRAGILRSRDRQAPPFCYSEIYIDPLYGDVVAQAETHSQLYLLIEKQHAVVIRRVEQEIEAVLADANIASRLNIARGSAVLLVRTKFFASDGRLVEVGLAHFPSGRYRVRITLDRRGAAAES
jgi:DNA-binding GntR family transcriptional regulator